MDSVFVVDSVVVCHYGCYCTFSFVVIGFAVDAAIFIMFVVAAKADMAQPWRHLLQINLK